MGTSSLVLNGSKKRVVSIETTRLQDAGWQRGMLSTALDAAVDEISEDLIYGYLNGYEFIQTVKESEAPINVFYRSLPVSVDEFNRTAPRVLNDLLVQLRYHRDRWIGHEIAFRPDQPVYERASMPYHHAPVEE